MFRNLEDLIVKSVDYSIMFIFTPIASKVTNYSVFLQSFALFSTAMSVKWMNTVTN